MDNKNGLLIPFTIKLGADPEVFLFGPDGRPIPAHRFFKTQKDEESEAKRDWSQRGNYGTPDGFCFRDGYAVEINFNPHHCRETVADRISSQVRHIIARANKGDLMFDEAKSILPRALPTIDIRDEDLEGAPPDVMETGCSPVFNAYDEHIEPRVPDVDFSTYRKRHAGGHIHISFSPVRDQAYKDKLKGSGYIPILARPGEHPLLVKILDWKLGVPASLIWNSSGTFERRRFYGRAGEYRVGSYGGDFQGIEYRVLGPEWITRAFYSSFVLGTAREVIHTFDRVARKGWTPELGSRVQRAINTGEGLWDVYEPIPGCHNRQIIEFLRDIVSEEGKSKFPSLGNPGTMGLESILSLLGRTALSNG